MSRVWSGDTVDGRLVIFCDQAFSALIGFAVTREEGCIVVRSLGGIRLNTTYALTSASIAAWLDMTADRFLGEVRS